MGLRVYGSLLRCRPSHFGSPELLEATLRCCEDFGVKFYVSGVCGISRLPWLGIASVGPRVLSVIWVCVAGCLAGVSLCVCVCVCIYIYIYIYIYMCVRARVWVVFEQQSCPRLNPTPQTLETLNTNLPNRPTSNLVKSHKPKPQNLKIPKPPKLPNPKLQNS